MRLSPTLDRDDDELVIPDVNKWIEMYLYDCGQQLYKSATILHYQNALKRFSRWYETVLEHGCIDRRNGKQFAFWLSQVKEKCDDHPGKPTEGRLSPVTVRRTVGVVRTFLRWLYRENYLQRNLADWFPLPKVSKIVQKVIETETLASLFDGASQGQMPLRDATLIALLADTGLRRTEIAMVTLSQVCFLDGQGAGYLQDVRGKGGTLRDVPFSPVIGELLKLWLTEREAISSSLSKVEETLFIKENGQRINPSSIYQILRRCARRANVLGEVWNTHSLRHGFATQFWRVNRDTKTLSMILGHNGQKITEDFYVHPVPDDLIQAHTSVLSRGDVPVPTMNNSRPQRPTEYLLRLAIQKHPSWRELGRQFQMTDTGVRKMAKRYGLLGVYYAAKETWATSLRQ